MVPRPLWVHDVGMKKDLEGLVVFLILLSVVIDATGWARVGYLALGAVMGGIGLWLKPRTTQPGRGDRAPAGGPPDA